jgi:hypothetical protein
MNRAWKAASLVVGLAGAALLQGGSASAQSRYEPPWCAMIPAFQSTPMQDCSYYTLEQCRQEVLGTGGWCNLNPYSRAPINGEGAPPPRRRW